MDQYEEMERAILNCYYVKPELMETKKLGARHFKKYHGLYCAFESMYNDVKTIDLSLLKSKSKEPGKVLDYLADVIDCTSVSGNYKIYERRLLKLYLEHDGIEAIHKLEAELYSRKIDLETFKNQVDEICGGYYD